MVVTRSTAGPETEKSTSSSVEGSINNSNHTTNDDFNDQTDDGGLHLPSDSTPETNNDLLNDHQDAHHQQVLDETASNNDDEILTEDHGCVQVAVRVRPLLPHEAGTTNCIECLQSTAVRRGGGAGSGAGGGGGGAERSNVIRLGGSAGPKFTFDEVFDGNTMQSQVYESKVAPLVDSCLLGYNATILAYGQTGSGKSHTIMGPAASMTTALLQEEERQQAGVVPRAIRSIFQKLDEAKQTADTSDSYEYTVRVQFLEVYGEEIRDLLNPQQPSSGSSKLSIRDVGNDEPEVVGASEEKVDSAEEALLCLTRGIYRRVTGSTAMNETSSRSHAILSLIVEQSTVLGPADNNDQTQEHVQCKRSRFNFVDLAGSERQKRTKASGKRLKEGIDINKGLLVLGNVISALGDPKKQGKTFVPYRDSKLTRLLKGSLGGNHKTLMIACISPSSSNMDESLNCLRYANRAKNIQNHAVVNLDATSQLVTDLRGKVQRLAADLIKAHAGKVSECVVPLEMVESLAVDGEGGGDEMNIMTMGMRPAVSPSPRLRATSPFPNGGFPSSIRRREPFVDQQSIKLKAENEAFRIQVESFTNGRDPSDALQQAYVTKATEYEQEIARLNKELQCKYSPPRALRGRPESAQRQTSNGSRQRSESPELSRLRTQLLGSLSQSSHLDAEVEAEERASKELTAKYLNHTLGNVDFVDEEDQRPVAPGLDGVIPDDASIKLEADLFSISNSITAKEELILQLQASQAKFESMREFYEEKLREMETVLVQKEEETEKLSEELKKLDSGNVKSKELSERLKQKQEQLLQLRKKQAELSRLTAVASRNESQISRLRNEVTEMKQKKVDLQKQITTERKNHVTEVQKLKKESMQKDRELNKTKRSLSKKEQEAQKAHQMAKSRLEQMNQLKSKYKETEKRQRMQTVKRGVMTKAGLDPVMVGRRQSKASSGEASLFSTADPNSSIVNVDSLREMFDQKVAEVGRRENLAEKLAQEWEEHLELTMQRDELVQNLENASQSSTTQAIESQIKFKEDRIRQLASRLGKRDMEPDQKQQGDDSFLFGSDFQQIAGQVALETSARIAAKVLFGMVVRERRRIASLARTASSLDEKVLEAEASVAAKEAAFRAYVDEQRLGAAALAQNQQEHILSLMELVKEAPEESLPDVVPKSGSPTAVSGGYSKLLVLANERISALERQLYETQLTRDAVQRHREREESALSALAEKTTECEDFEEEIDLLRAALRRIREEIGRGDMGPPSKNEDATDPSIETVVTIVTEALHPSSTSSGSTKSKRKRSSPSSNVMGQSPSMTPRIKRETQFMHSSDSDEIPDWAEDILADLAVIAEGKMPTALKDSKEVMEAEAQLNGNVFDRLTNPETFTGVQKQRNAQGNRPIKARQTPVFSSEVQKQRKVIDQQQVAETIDKVFAPITERDKKKDSIGRKHQEKLANRSEAEKRSVFDRLLSPSNLTGTQRRRFQDQKGRTQPLETAIESQHVALRAKTQSGSHHSVDNSNNSNDFDLSEGAEADTMLDDILKSEDMTENDETAGAQESRQSTSSFTSPFSKAPTDREGSISPLQAHHTMISSSPNYLNTTQSFAKKQSTNIAEKLLDEILEGGQNNHHHHDHDDHSKQLEPRFERVEKYVSEDVFERLQRKTTEAYSMKKHST